MINTWQPIEKLPYDRIDISRLHSDEILQRDLDYRVTPDRGILYHRFRLRYLMKKTSTWGGEGIERRTIEWYAQQDLSPLADADYIFLARLKKFKARSIAEICHNDWFTPFSLRKLASHKMLRLIPIAQDFTIDYA